MRKKLEKIETLEDFSHLIAITVISQAEENVAALAKEEHVVFWTEYLIFVLFSLDLVISDRFIRNSPQTRWAFRDMVVANIMQYISLDIEGEQILTSIIEDRFEEYAEAFKDEREPGRLFWLGRSVAKNVAEQHRNALVVAKLGMYFVANTRLFKTLFEDPQLFLW